MTSRSISSSWPPPKEDLAWLARGLTHAEFANCFGVTVEDVVALEWEYAGTIKGSITRKGKRIYHVPGGQWYDRIKIDPAKGERWFGSEADARAAGWRSAGRYPMQSRHMLQWSILALGTALAEDY